MFFWSVFFLFAFVSAGNIGDECNNSIKNARGLCTPVRQCWTLMEKIKQPLSREMINVLRRTHCGFQGTEPLVCCSDDLDEDLHHGMRIITNHPNLHLINDENCGPFYSNRIFNGKFTDLFEYPWMVLIGYLTKDGEIRYRCSGSVINHRYILTAAHCIYKLQKFIVGIRVGEYDTSNDPDCKLNNLQCAPSVKNYEIEKLIFHRKFTKRTKSHDIGLIRLKTPLEFNQNVHPICLPVGEELQRNILTRKISVVAGWGQTETGFYNTILLKTYLPMFPIQKCIEVYSKIVNLSIAQMCAGGDKYGSDTCYGDSGGPLFHPVSTIDMDARWFQFGIVSFGPEKCGTFGVPAVYTRVAYFMDWILNNIEE